MFYTYPKLQGPYEFFKGTRYGRSDFAGASLDYNQVVKAVAYLNGESKEGFTVHLTQETLVKSLKPLTTDNLQVEDRKLEPVPTNGCPYNPTAVPEMYTVTVT